MDIVDVDSNKWSQYATATAFPLSIVYRKEGRALRAYERKVCEAADCVLVTTEREARLGREIAPGARFHVVSNGVDTSYFAPSIASVAPRGRCVIFTGDMAYFPNQEAAIFFTHQVLPLIRRDVPDVRFLVVGRNPDRRVEALRGIEGVEVSGSVPDVRPWLARADAAVAPLTIAAGIQNKILEAMSSGLPVVATSRAVQGLTRPVADLIETADTPGEFARRAVRLLQNPEDAQRRGAEGRQRVGAEYNWDRSLQRVQQLVDDPHRRRDGSTPLDPHASHFGTQPAAAARG
jgi:sugar transferase (PEP-CTERM/EpsH1 system associated)